MPLQHAHALVVIRQPKPGRQAAHTSADDYGVVHEGRGASNEERVKAGNANLAPRSSILRHTFSRSMSFINGSRYATVEFMLARLM
jgi:hypothetical protein